MSVHEASKFKVCLWCCAKVGNITISSHRLLRETAGEFTQLGEQYTKVFEPLSADRNCPQPNVLCTTCKLYIVKVVFGDPPQNSQINLTGHIFCMRRVQHALLMTNVQCVKMPLDLDDVLLPNQTFLTQNQTFLTQNQKDRCLILRQSCQTL